MPIVDPSLPGAELVESALADLQRNVHSSAAYGLEVVAPRLRLVGFEVPPLELDDAPEIELYRRLSEEHVDDPFSAYNAMLRRLNSFAAALEAKYFRQVSEGP